MEGEDLRLLSLQSPRLGRGKTSLAARLLCFSSLQVELQFLSLGLYYSFYTSTPALLAHLYMFL